MGVNVKLADAREIDGRKRKAGDVVDVAPGEARRLVALGAGVKVDDKPAPAPEQSSANAPAQIKPGAAGRKG